MSGKESRHFRLSAEARELLTLIQGRLGISATAVIEMALRLLAERLGLRKFWGDVEKGDE